MSKLFRYCVLGMIFIPFAIAGVVFDIFKLPIVLIIFFVLMLIEYGWVVEQNGYEYDGIPVDMLWCGIAIVLDLFLDIDIFID